MAPGGEQYTMCLQAGERFSRDMLGYDHIEFFFGYDLMDKCHVY